VGHLAEGLKKWGADVVLYANGDSKAEMDVRWIYPHTEWPIKVPTHAWLREINHGSWAVADAFKHCDVIHVQSAAGPFILPLC